MLLVRRLLSLSLACLLLLGSVSLTVNRHFCMGELQSVALFAAAEVCHEEVTPSCPLHPKAEQSKKDCCENDQELVKSDDDRQLVDAPSWPAVTWTLTPSPLSPLTPSPQHPRPRKNTSFQHYRPPPLLVDAPRQYQVFRL